MQNENLSRRHPTHVSATIFGSTVLALATIGGAALQTSNFAAKTPAGQAIEIAGVCDATQGGIECWKPDGAPDKPDAALVDAFFIANQDKKLSLAFKSRSRIVLIREVSRTRWDRVNIAQFTDTAGRSLEHIGEIGAWDAGEPTTTLFWYYPDKTATTADLDISTWETVPEQPSLTLKPGATARLRNETVRIDSIDRIDPNSDSDPWPFEPQNGAKWEVDLSYVPDSPATVPILLSASPCDFNGNVIRDVDAGGNPDGLKPFSGFRSLLNPIGTENPRAFRLCVKPALVQSLTLYMTVPLKLHFDRIRLDPNRPGLNVAGTK